MLSRAALTAFLASQEAPASERSQALLRRVWVADHRLGAAPLAERVGLGARWHARERAKHACPAIAFLASLYHQMSDVLCATRFATAVTRERRGLSTRPNVTDKLICL
jgi:hypothetical protein